MNKRIKYGGRQKGTENKITRDLKEVFKNIIDANLDTLEKDLQQLAPKERIDVIIKMSEFVLPKLQRVANDTIDKNHNIDIILMGEKWSDKKDEKIEGFHIETDDIDL